VYKGQAGYYAPAVVNFLTNIGWNFGDEREVFDVAEAIERFDGTGINPANSIYPIEKLDWLNGVYIREKMTTEELARYLREALEKAGLEVNVETLLKVVPIVRTRIKTFNDVVEMAGFFFREEFTPPPVEDIIQKKMDAASTLHALEVAYEHLRTLDDFSHDSQEAAMRALAEELSLSAGQLFGSLRAAVTGQKVSPPVFETMAIIGRDEVLRRIRLAIDLLAAAE
jgi:glutamyl-tRNA synthetase